MLYGFIYMVTSPSGKSYIGQVVEFLRDGTKKGIYGRWLQHCQAARRNSTKGCVYLYHAINKYKPENFTIQELIKCKKSELNMYEKKFIKMYNTLAPNGYNLQTGGKCTTVSEITRMKQSRKMKTLLKCPEKRKIWSKAKLGVRQRKKRKCKKVQNQNLPKYIHYRESHGGKYKGYVVEHPSGSKRFGKSRYTLEENLKLAKNFVKILESGEISS